MGEIVAITGENGVGKSTLCKIATGLLKENFGKVYLEGKKQKKNERLEQSFFVGQDADYQLYASTVWEEIMLNMPYNLGLEKEASNLLQKLGLAEYKSRHPASLSGGQKQRVLLAAAILRKRPLLVLDEPTSGLDGEHMRIIADILRDVAKQGICILLITHDAELIIRCADSVFHLA